jgi:hypothetical protein
VRTVTYTTPPQTIYLHPLYLATIGMVLRKVLAAAMLLTTLLSPGAHAQAGEGLEDPPNDVRPVEILPVAAPTTAWTSAADLRGAWLDDDEESLRITVRVQDLRLGTSGTCCAQFVFYEATFSLAGTNIVYYAAAELGSPAGADFVAHPDRARGFFWACNPADCRFQSADVHLDPQADTMELQIPKAALLGRIGGTAPLEGAPARLQPGHRLEQLRVVALHEQLAVFWFDLRGYDRMPDEGTGPAYTLRAGAANTVTSLRLPSASGVLPLEAGLNQTIPFALTNGAEGKRLLRLDYTLEGDPAHTSSYRVDGPRLITLPAGTTRNFTLTVHPLSGASPEAPVHLAVRARSVGHPDELAVDRARLRPTPALEPGRNTLHVQGWRLQTPAPVADTVLCHPVYTLAACANGYLSRESDAAAGAPVIRGRDWFNGQGMGERFFLVLDTGSPRPLVLDSEGNVELQLQVLAPVAAPGLRVAGDLLVYGDQAEGVLASFSGTVDAGPTPATVRLRGPVQLPPTDVVAVGKRLALYLDISAPLGSPGQATFFLGGVELVAGASRLELPLRPLPEHLLTPPVASPLQLASVGSAEEFVNPGRTLRLRAALLNQGDATVRAALVTSPAPEGWNVDLRPGARYVLDPGDVVTVDVLLTPPASAREGEAARLRLNATSEGVPPVSLGLGATVVTGVQIGEDGTTYDPDADAAAKLERPGGASPAPAVILALAAALLALGRRQRV